MFLIRARVAGPGSSLKYVKCYGFAPGALRVARLELCAHVHVRAWCVRTCAVLWWSEAAAPCTILSSLDLQQEPSRSRRPQVLLDPASAFSADACPPMPCQFLLRAEEKKSA